MGYIEQSTVMKSKAAAALSVGDQSPLKKICVPSGITNILHKQSVLPIDIKKLDEQSSGKIVYNISINNCPGMSYTFST